MNLPDLEAFVAVAETGSVNRAALRLHLTQPAATRRVQNFEAALGGAALLDRSTKPPGLTPVGRQVLEQCRHVLKAVAGLEAIASARSEPQGELRIGIAHGLGEVVLDSPLDDVRVHFPRVRLQVSSNWTARLIEEIRTGALDCALGMLAEDHPLLADVHAMPLGQETVEIVTARDAKLDGERNGPLRLSDLASQAWVLNPAGCGCRAALQRAFDRAGSPMRVGAEVFGEELQLSMIAHHAGLGLVPRRQFDHSRHRTRLRRVKVSDFALEVVIVMLHGPALGGLAPAVLKLQTRIAKRLEYNKRSA